MKKHYIRQQDNLLYEKLLYTGEFHQPSNFTFVVYDKKTVSHDSFDDVTELSSFIDKPGVKWLLFSYKKMVVVFFLNIRFFVYLCILKYIKNLL